MEYIYTPANQLEGDPYQVVRAQFEQAEAVAELLEIAINDCYKMGRISEMEREIAGGNEPNGANFSNTALGKSIGGLQTSVSNLQKGLGFIKQAATYDPKHPPKIEED